MKLTHQELRTKFEEFWKSKGHNLAEPASIVLTNDPTTLFNSSGMQQLIPYLLGEKHENGKLLYNIQPSFRAVDIEEVGDNRHTTFFEMMGNWSLGEYFKEKQLPWFWEFLMSIGFEEKKDRLHVTYFEGNKEVPRDTETRDIWKNIGLSEDHIHPYGVDKNWWSRSGTPSQMPAGEIGGPDSEVFYDFGENLKLHENSIYKEQKCHPNCDCGRFMEIGNSVFIQYIKMEDGSLKELNQKNVDFGGGLERILAAANNIPDVFLTDLYSNKEENGIIETLEEWTHKKYSENKKPMQIIADHLKAATFMIANGVQPSNKEHGYVLRRLLRRSAVNLHQLGSGLTNSALLEHICDQEILRMYDGIYFDRAEDQNKIPTIIENEMNKFAQSLDRGLKEIQKIDENKVDGKLAFDLYQNFGFPLEITEELIKQKGYAIDRKQFYDEFEKHKNASRTSSAGKFKGGLADHSEQVLKYHTATHLLHQALFDVLGNDVRQEGSNITGERLRFDFYTSKQFSPEDKQKVEDIINTKIKEELPVNFKILPKTDAEKIGARSFFREKYPEMVKVYFIGSEDPAAAYSKEFCGGPHVHNTKEIGKIDIYKMERIGSNLYRIYAK